MVFVQGKKIQHPTIYLPILHSKITGPIGQTEKWKGKKKPEKELQQIEQTTMHTSNEFQWTQQKIYISEERIFFRTLRHEIDFKNEVWYHLWTSLTKETSQLPAEGERRSLSWSASSLSVGSWVVVDKDSVPSSSQCDEGEKHEIRGWDDISKAKKMKGNNGISSNLYMHDTQVAV